MNRDSPFLRPGERKREREREKDCDDVINIRRKSSFCILLHSHSLTDFSVPVLRVSGASIPALYSRIVLTVQTVTISNMSGSHYPLPAACV